MTHTPITLLQAHWDGELPVKVEAIAHAAGISVDRSFGSIAGQYSGSIARDDDGHTTISIDITEARVRQRFTIAHEIGHWALGHLNDKKRCFRDGPAEFSSNATDSEEREANNFAAQLLMPETLIRWAIEKKGIESIPALANLFDVSKVAMTYRLKNLGFIDG
ncbi:hypothetical protein QR66_01765 [Chromobacterium piscinae]|nr:hypothetical protein QR66_01765 [Chromobacterium piscinae]